MFAEAPSSYSQETSGLFVSTYFILNNTMTMAGIMLSEIDDGVANDFDSPNRDINSSQYICQVERMRYRCILTLWL